MKWVSVFPPNPEKHGAQNLSAVIILYEIEKGFPLAMYERAKEAGVGRNLNVQETMIFQHKQLEEWIRI